MFEAMIHVSRKHFQSSNETVVFSQVDPHVGALAELRSGVQLAEFSPFPPKLSIRFSP